MVLSLFDCCRVGIRNALESGFPLAVHHLPPHFRQPILDMVLMHGTINEPACLAVFGSKEFLDGISVLDTQRGQVDDHAFLNQVTRSLATVASNGEKLGGNISELRLNLYMKERYRSTSFNLESIIRLIAQCPRLVKLEIQLTRHHEDEISGEKVFKLMNVAIWDRQYSSIMENLQVFSFFARYREHAFFESRHPLLKYLKKLTSLHLDNCRIDPGYWKELFGQVGQTLISLHLGSDLSVFDDSNYVLPASLPTLKSLHIGNDQWMREDSERFMTNLKGCRQLEHLYLRMCTQWNIPKAVQLDLVSLTADLEISLYVHYRSGDDIFENASEFKFVNLLGENVKHIELITSIWDQRITSALRHLVEKCQHLISIDLRISERADKSPELGEAKMSLASLFANKERARKVEKLCLCGKYDESILESIFGNCVNLNYFWITECPQFIDRHLIEFAGRGGQLSYLLIWRCDNVISDGLIPILKNSGDKLSRFFVGAPARDFAYEAAIEFCRYVKWGGFRNKDLKELACLKSFIKVDHLPFD